jgi:hypothetical protein
VPREEVDLRYFDKPVFRGADKAGRRIVAAPSNANQTPTLRLDLETLHVLEMLLDNRQGLLGEAL